MNACCINKCKKQSRIDLERLKPPGYIFVSRHGRHKNVKSSKKVKIFLEIMEQ